MSAKMGRNAPCPCGSGKKFKKCCKDAATATKLLQLNEIAREIFIDRPRKENPEAFAHEHRYTAYHEAGHALMEMLFYRDLKRVTIIPTVLSLNRLPLQHGTAGIDFARGFCESIEHGDISEEDGPLFSLEQAAIALAGKVAADSFCRCDAHKELNGNSKDIDSDEGRVAIITANVKGEHKQIFALATAATIQRHRLQLDAIAQALIEHETLSGSQVFEILVSSGWNPDTDCDPDQFYNEALGISAEEAA
jgi:hypothetical protein